MYDFLFFVIVLLITIFLDVIDVTLSRIAFLSQLLERVYRWCRAYSSTPVKTTPGLSTDYHVLETKVQ